MTEECYARQQKNNVMKKTMCLVYNRKTKEYCAGGTEQSKECCTGEQRKHRHAVRINIRKRSMLWLKTEETEACCEDRHK
jgi:hypothetical protein